MVLGFADRDAIGEADEREKRKLDQRDKIE
jgi:hypothetical protein